MSSRLSIRKRGPQVAGAALLGLLLAAGTAAPLHAQKPRPNMTPIKMPQPPLLTPCCGIESVNAATGQVTVRNKSTGATSQFPVADAGLRASLHPGQIVWLDPCCGVVGIYGVPGFRITAIDPRGGSVTVQESATGATCRLRMSSASAYRGLSVGQRVDAASLPQAQLQGGSTAQAANSSCGWNGSRNTDTRPKECVDVKTGKHVACPSDMPKSSK